MLATRVRPISPSTAARHALATDEQLVSSIRGNDPAAFEALYERHQRELLSFCLYMLGSRADAEEALQVTFASAYRALLADERPVVLRPWLFAIARNQCLSILRRRRPTVELGGEAATGDDPAASGDLFRELELREEVRHTLAGVRELPEGQRAAMVLAELHGLSQSEIGSVLGLRPEQVKALVYQARSSLISERSARDADCREIREELDTARGAALLKGKLRKHVRALPGLPHLRRRHVPPAPRRRGLPAAAAVADAEAAGAAGRPLQRPHRTADLRRRYHAGRHRGRRGAGGRRADQGDRGQGRRRRGAAGPVHRPRRARPQHPLGPAPRRVRRVPGRQGPRGCHSWAKAKAKAEGPATTAGPSAGAGAAAARGCRRAASLRARAGVPPLGGIEGGAGGSGGYGGGGGGAGSSGSADGSGQHGGGGGRPTTRRASTAARARGRRCGWRVRLQRQHDGPPAAQSAQPAEAGGPVGRAPPVRRRRASGESGQLRRTRSLPGGRGHPGRRPRPPAQARRPRPRPRRPERQNRGRRRRRQAPKRSKESANSPQEAQTRPHGRTQGPRTGTQRRRRERNGRTARTRTRTGQARIRTRPHREPSTSGNANRTRNRAKAASSANRNSANGKRTSAPRATPCAASGQEAEAAT